METLSTPGQGSFLLNLCGDCLWVPLSLCPALLPLLPARMLPRAHPRTALHACLHGKVCPQRTPAAVQGLPSSSAVLLSLRPFWSQPELHHSTGERKPPGQLFRTNQHQSPMAHSRANASLSTFRTVLSPKPPLLRVQMRDVLSGSNDNVRLNISPARKMRERSMAPIPASVKFAHICPGSRSPGLGRQQHLLGLLFLGPMADANSPSTIQEPPASLFFHFLCPFLCSEYLLSLNTI